MGTDEFFFIRVNPCDPWLLNLLTTLARAPLTLRFLKFDQRNDSQQLCRLRPELHILSVDGHKTPVETS